jgi:hypothetical protein
MRIILTQDIISNGKDKRCYGFKGQLLEVLKDRGDGSFVVKGNKENFIVFEKNNNFKFI